MQPFIWRSDDDARMIWKEFMRDGVCWVRPAERMSGAIELAERAPHRLVEALLGWTPAATQVTKPDRCGHFHVDDHPFLPPPLKIAVCAHAAGSDAMFIDTWQLLSDLSRERSPLFAALFETQRTIGFHNFVWCGPTFSIRASNFLCVHNGFPLESDAIGTAFQQMLDDQEPVRCQLETGDLVICNNHRVLQGPGAFVHRDHRMIPIVAWLSRALPAPEMYLTRAARVATRTEQRARELPIWMRKRLGYSGLGHEHYDIDDLLAHYRGELVENVGRQVQLLRAHAHVGAERRAS